MVQHGTFFQYPIGTRRGLGPPHVQYPRHRDENRRRVRGERRNLHRADRSHAGHEDETAVKIELTRKEDFLSATPRHSMEIWIKTGAKKDGTLIAMQAKIKVDTGAYAYFGPNTTSNAVILITGPYRIPNVLTEGFCAYTNKISCGPCRGPGAPQVHFAGETQLDKIARKLGMDPVELRMKNAYKANDLTATGQVLTEGGYQEALVELKKYMEERLTVLPGADEGKTLGVGVAGGFWGMEGSARARP